MQTEQVKKLVLEALEDSKAKDWVVLDVKAASSVTDYMIIASGSSSRQVTALAQKVQAVMKEQGIQVLGIEGLDAGEWVLVDLGDILVHLMQPQIREFYELEKLWGEFSTPATQQA